jgi:hypothetical protein
MRELTLYSACNVRKSRQGNKVMVVNMVSVAVVVVVVVAAMAVVGG